MAHEDSRVSQYGERLAATGDKFSLYQLRRDRFGHLPHWGRLDAEDAERAGKVNETECRKYDPEEDDEKMPV